MTERVLVGRIGRAQGLKGELRLTSFTQDPLAIADYGPLESEDGTRRFVIESVVLRGDVVVARIAGVNDRTAAEALTNEALYVARDRIPMPADPDEFLMADLIGCDVATPAGTGLGTIVDVPNYGAGDLIEVALYGGRRTVLIPLTKAFVPEVDIAGRRVVVDPPDGLIED